MMTRDQRLAALVESRRMLLSGEDDAESETSRFVPIDAGVLGDFLNESVIQCRK